MLTFVLAESGLELCPREVWSHPSVKKSAESRGKEAGEILLDRSLHHKAMLVLRDQYKRGRPDIAHISLLEATGTPLYKMNMLKVYIHTINDRVIEVGEGVRLPKTFYRFQGVMEKLLLEGSVGSEGRTLLRVWDQDFHGLIDRVRPDVVLGYTRLGMPMTIEDSVRPLLEAERPMVVIGGFSRGHFSREVSMHLTYTVAISTMPLEAHVVIARSLYEYEKAVLKVVE